MPYRRLGPSCKHAADVRAAWPLDLLPVLAVLVGWICVLFLGFGLFTRFNVTVVVASLFGALSVSGAIFIIADLSEPFSGLLRVSDAPLLKALAQIKQ